MWKRVLLCYFRGNHPGGLAAPLLRGNLYPSRAPHLLKWEEAVGWKEGERNETEVGGND